MAKPISAAEALRQIREDLVSEEETTSSDESGDDMEDEHMHFELRLDPAEDIRVE